MEIATVIRRLTSSAAAALWLTLYASVLSAQDDAVLVGDPSAGEAVAGICATCHGENGNSPDPNQWPHLAKQGAPYIVKQLQNFLDPEAEGGRDNAIMYGMASGLEEQDMADLAAFYAKQDIIGGVTDAALAEHGENLYRGGDIERGISACIGCHGPSAHGNPAARFPRLAGQAGAYVSAQLAAFRNGSRANDPNGMMRSIAARLSDQDIAALASYLQGLR